MFLLINCVMKAILTRVMGLPFYTARNRSEGNFSLYGLASVVCYIYVENAKGFIWELYRSVDKVINLPS